MNQVIFFFLTTQFHVTSNSTNDSLILTGLDHGLVIKANITTTKPDTRQGLMSYLPQQAFWSVSRDGTNGEVEDLLSQICDG